MSIIVVYMTAGNRDEAARLAKTLVEQRLVACVNIIDGVRSFYEWNGALQDDQEVVMIAKTDPRLIDDLVAAAKSMHSYDCPCIVEMAATGGNHAFLKWVRDQVDVSRKGN